MKLHIALLLPAVALAYSGGDYSRGYVRGHADNRTTVEVLEVTAADIAAAPDAVDWSVNATTAVRDQGKCGSCWAMSTIETIESGIFMQSGVLPELLSTEQLVSCDTLFDDGCNGGDPHMAYNYFTQMANGDVASNADYPDKSSASGVTGKCTWNNQAVAKVHSIAYAVPNCDTGDCSKQSEDALAAALAKYGPLSICINSGYQQTGDWAKYTTGILQGSCKAEANLIDHCVQLVGYNKTGDTPWWKVRNSWGTTWGEKGFIRLPYGDQNSCCVACEASVFGATMK